MGLLDIFNRQQVLGGGILTGDAIDRAIQSKYIAIKDYDRANLNPNSYNIHNGDSFTTYQAVTGFDLKDPSTYEETETLPIPEDGVWFRPGTLYLVPTYETIDTDAFVPLITGRSSIGRLGISIHQEAGFGDIGYHGTLTMQIKVTYPVKIYPRMLIGQVYFLTPFGYVTELYHGRYQNSEGAVSSKFGG